MQVEILMTVCALAGTVLVTSGNVVPYRFPFLLNQLKALENLGPEIQMRGLVKRVDFGSHCQTFIHEPNMLPIDGGIFRKVGSGLTVRQCQEACLATNDMYCVAAVVREGTRCFLSGFKLRFSSRSTYFLRICEKGPECFKPRSGLSLGHTNVAETIPWYYDWSLKSRQYFCMARCEESDECVGVELQAPTKPSDKTSHCYRMTKTQTIPSPNSDLFIRQC